MHKSTVAIIGGGLAGCEAAWQLAKRGIQVNIYEMRGIKDTFAHKSDVLAELVCSNSFRSDDAENSAIGVLHQEMRLLDSIILTTADKHAVPAGGALAVDRDNFSLAVQKTLMEHENVEVIRKEITDLSALTEDKIIIATGPLSSEAMQKYWPSLRAKNFCIFLMPLPPPFIPIVLI